MSAVATWKNRFAEFAVVPSRSGVPTVVHMPSGQLLHSRVDPVAEAAEIADANRMSDAPATVVLGGGLGYLAEAVLKTQGPNHSVIVIEPDADLHALSLSIRPASVYATSGSISVKRVISPRAMTEKCSGISGSANLIISPYFERLAGATMSALSGFLRILRSERASKVVYDPLVVRNTEMNQSCLILLPSALDVRESDGKTIIVAGAGPSLDLCADVIRECRNNTVIIAASGAVPPLQARGIEPDWVIAMEGKEIILRDLASLASISHIVAFPSVHPGVLSAHMRQIYAGVRSDGTGLETRGGSTLIPALDFAMKCSSADIVLVGADLSNHKGGYAQFALRNDEGVAPANGDPPKYLAMRTGLERLIEKNRNSERRVYHVLDEGAILTGTERLLPKHLDRILNRMVEREAASERKP